MKNKRKYVIIILILYIFIMTSCEINSHMGDTVNDEITSQKTENTAEKIKITEETTTNENTITINLNDLVYQYEFKLKNIPTEEEIRDLNHSHAKAPYITKKDNKLLVGDCIQTLKTFHSRALGDFIAGDYGEFGSSAYYISVYYNEFYEINTPASDFYVLNNDYDVIYCVYGLGHLGILEGTITRLLKIDGKWQKDENYEINLEDYIHTFCVENDTVYVVTNNKIVMIKDDKIEKVLMENAFWNGWLYPNSTVKIDNLLYIGMRGGIASYNLETGELLWYEVVDDKD